MIDGTEFGLKAIHTPGHAPNHLCFFLEEERVLFSGDHVLQGTTTVVIPERGGDMKAYLASLEQAAQDPAPLAHLPRTRRRGRGGEGASSTSTWRIGGCASARSTEGAARRTGEDHRPRGGDLHRDSRGAPRAGCEQVHAHLLKMKAEGKVAGTNVRAAWKVA